MRSEVEDFAMWLTTQPAFTVGDRYPAYLLLERVKEWEERPLVANPAQNRPLAGDTGSAKDSARAYNKALSDAVENIADPRPPEHIFADDVVAELRRARAKFPYTEACVVALMEEVGELAKAMLDESPHRIYKEAVQVAAMAARAALEGDPTLDDYRKRHGGVGALPARGERPPPTHHPDGLRFG